MKVAERIIKMYEESLRDMLEKKFGPLKSVDGVLVNDEKNTSVGYSHRAACCFEIGDKLYDESWVHPDDNPEDSWDEQKNTCKTPFKQHGTITIKNRDQLIQSAKNFQSSVS